MTPESTTQAGAITTVSSAAISYIIANPVVFFFMAAGFFVSLIGLWIQYRRDKREREFHKKRMKKLEEQ